MAATPTRLLTKREAGYDRIALLDRGVGHNCGTCALFQRRRRRCTAVEGAIEATDTCNVWTAAGDHDAEPPTWLSGERAHASLDAGRRLTKSEAGYVGRLPPDIAPRTAGELRNAIMCGTCAHLSSTAHGRGRCYPVRGALSLFGCCNLYQQPNGVETPNRRYASGATVAARIGDIEDLVT